MTLRAERIAVAALVDVDLERVLVARAVGDVTAGAGDRARLETAAQRQRLRPVEAVRTSVGPKLALEIVFRNRLADQERVSVSRSSCRRP